MTKLFPSHEITTGRFGAAFSQDNVVGELHYPLGDWGLREEDLGVSLRGSEVDPGEQGLAEREKCPQVNRELELSTVDTALYKGYFLQNFQDP